MKLFAALILGFMMTSNVFASETKVASCLLNRSVNLLVVENYDEEEGVASLKLIADIFGQGQKEIASAERGSYELINYGDTVIGVINHGRSGYAMFHIEKNKTTGKLVGHVDISLFGPASDDVNTHGLREVSCQAI